MFHGALDDYEAPTHEYLQRYCNGFPQSLVYYFHCKGVTHPDSPLKERIVRWRMLMEQFILIEWSDCVEALLSGNVACGVNLKGLDDGVSWRHFSGNVWWARCDHINRLPPPPDLGTPYFKQHSDTNTAVFAGGGRRRRCARCAVSRQRGRLSGSSTAFFAGGGRRRRCTRRRSRRAVARPFGHSEPAAAGAAAAPGTPAAPVPAARASARARESREERESVCEREGERGKEGGREGSRREGGREGTDFPLELTGFLPQQL